MTDTQTLTDETAENALTLSDIFYLFRLKWYWFATSLVVFACVGVLYLMVTPPTYTRTASLLIKNDRKGSSIAAEMADFGIRQPNSNIDNEMLTLKSPALMEEVIQRLKLNDSYSTQKGLRRVDLYRATPFAISPESDSLPAFSCKAVLDDDVLTLTDFVVGDDERPATVKGRLGDTVDTPAGRLYLSVAPWKGDKRLLGKPVSFAHTQPARIAQRYAATVKTELGSEDATIIDISYRATSPRLAEDIINTLIQVYNDRWVLDKNQMAVSTSRFINERLGVIESELGNVDSDISSYKSEHLLPDVGAASEMYLRQSEETQREISDVGSQLQVARHLRGELAKERIDQPLPTSSGLQSSDLNMQISTYNTMVIDRNRLVAGSSENNPLVKERTEALQLLHATIISTVDNLIAALDARAGSLHSRKAAASGQLAASPNQARYLLSVERQQKVKEQLYLYLLEKREENELNQAFTSYNTRLITPPIGSEKPTSPNRRNVVFVLVLLALVVPAVVLVLIQLFDTKVRSRRDLEKLSIPYVGEIPQAGASRHGIARLRRACADDISTRVLIEEGNTDVTNEAFRVVRSNLEFVVGAALESTASVIMVTSAVPGSGKTFVSMNLGAAMALKGKRVAVVDLDMRRASLSGYVGSPRSGISSVLIGRAALSDVIVNGVGGLSLSVLPVGAIPPNPAELLYKPEFSRLMDELKRDFDIVLLDCPPAEVVADAKIISKYADLTIWMVRAGLFEKSMLPQLQRYYDEHRYPGLCVMLNGTDPMHTSSYQRYGYSYGNYYSQNKRRRE